MKRAFHQEDVKSPRKRNKMVSKKIELSAQERQLTDLLLGVANYIDESKEVNEKTEIRFAGGWVRDKLLGLGSNDIDAALNGLTGVAFTNKIKDYVEIEGNLEKHAMKRKDLGNLHTIAKNPDKSKHLETATVRLFDHDVDFVNLRKETYSTDSRTPEVEYGTAEDDAFRRDSTINALFYNIHTDSVEDFTGGLADLETGLIRTPLDPYTTLMDDPLRILRLVRFATRFDFKIDDKSKAAMSLPEIREALRLKISRERVGQELEKMLKGIHFSV